MKSKRRAFTLIELLVVIAIIALLLSILMPSLQKAKKIAKTTICKSTLKQMYIAHQAFMSENADKSFARGHCNDSNADQIWMGILGDYYGGGKTVPYCPSAKVTRSEDIHGSAKHAWGNPDDNTSDQWMGNYTGSYGYNSWLYRTDGSRQVFGDVNEHWGSPLSVRVPSMVPLFADCTWPEFWPVDTDVPVRNIDDPWSKGWVNMLSRSSIDRHSMSVNVLMLDGVAVKTDLADLWKLKWSKNFKRTDVVVERD